MTMTPWNHIVWHFVVASLYLILGLYENKCLVYVAATLYVLIAFEIIVQACYCEDTLVEVEDASCKV